MAEQEPTLWELMRAVERIEKKLNGVLTVEVFRAYQEGTDRRFQQSETDLTEWKAESRGAHVSLDGRIDAQRNRQDAFEERLRTDRQKWQLTGVTAALGLVASIVMFFLNGGAS